MGRTVSAGGLVRDQIDIYFPVNSFKRVTGILSSGIQPTIFVNNVGLVWSVIDGTTVPDSSISSGFVYFSEINPGFYGIRFFPDRTGFWKMVFAAQAFGLEVVKEFDVVPSTSGPVSPNSLNASFIKS